MKTKTKTNCVVEKAAHTKTYFPGRMAGIIAVVLGLLFQAQMIQAQTYSLSSAWSAANGTANLATGDRNRGMAYDSVNNQVFVAARTGGGTGFIDVFNGTSGALLSGAGGIAGANLGIDQVGVGDDGILYGVPPNRAAQSWFPDCWLRLCPAKSGCLCHSRLQP